jgi:hypothetical protein
MLLSLTVVRKKKNARSVKSALKIHGERIAGKLNDFFALIRREGQIVVDYFGLLSDLENSLDAALSNLEQADWAHLAEAANDRRLRRQRDELASELHRTLKGLSGNADSTYEKGTAEEILGLGVGLRAEPELMVEIGSRVSATLADPGFAFPAPGLGGVALDPVELKAEVDGPLSALTTVIKALDDEKKKFDASLAVKQDAITEFDKVYSRTTVILQDFFGFAGEEMLGERIRPTVRKRPETPPEELPGDPDEPIEVDENGEPVP